ncbi:PaaI family thioesterase [Nocardia sp. NPDC004068]|uniref:PaaI family thioesterase n=1 Tax=Nocardia sp. NPDC004068 TaxID=3364303 RepID=UPI0036A1A6B0
MTTTITIPGYAHGYPGVAFGGYVAGLLAERTSGSSVRVDFRRAVPVDTPVLLAETASGCSLLDTDGNLLAEAGPDTDAALSIPPPPTLAEAKAASATSATADRAVADCYGCGTTNTPGRGLRLHPWGLRARNQVIAAWIPDPELAAPTGTLTSPNVWSALDCPGGWVAILASGMRPGGLTAAMRVTVHQPVSAGEEHLVHAWPISVDGRKYTVGVAVSTADGMPCATAEALWIEPRG